MQLEIDCDVKAVAEFMQANMPASKLLGVATAIGRLAPILWGHFSADDVYALALRGEPVTSRDDLHIPPSSSESRLAIANAGDGSAAETGVIALQ